MVYNNTVMSSPTPSTTPEIPLTDEQQAIVAHNHGPALVFAVAGAGKTTAMTHRIERLIREDVFPARAILATSFSKASVTDIKHALARWPHCAGVTTQTLHSVGWGVLRLAQRRGLGPGLALGEGDEGSDSQLLGKVLGRAWREKVAFAPELDGLDRQDFLTYVGVMKANLWYADLDAAHLPPSALAIAKQAPAPPGFAWYRDLFKLYERVRLEENVLTFDDMLLGGWECLHRFPEVRAEAQRRWQCVLVDEFQDVNPVQSALLDVLTEPHRNYMAIGDDDQTIYEWRGADPGLILSFGRRYGARRYFIGDNFRSHAAPLALAGRVIAHNRRREPKHLSLTRGFGGHLAVHTEDTPETQGKHIAALIKEARAAGRRADEIAVLVRLYAQTPSLEQALVEAEIAYKVVGGSPFYARPEVLTLLDYVHLSGTLGEDWETRWARVANKPTRYVSRVLTETITQAVRGGRTLPQTLEGAASASSDHLAGRLRDLADTLVWLAGARDTLPAGAALTLLDRKIGYGDFLRHSSGFPETGAARAANLDAFLRYAQSWPTLTALMAHLDDLAARGVGQAHKAGADAVSLLTVFRAKGLQWPTVFLPDCNGGVFPYGGPEELEEERRLFYVALTRTRDTLHLHVVRTEPPSPFLREADWEATLASVAETGTLLARSPGEWTTRETLTLAQHIPALGLERYVKTWADAAHIQAAARHLSAFHDAAQAQDVFGALGLTDAQASFWRGLLPADWPAADLPDFADLAALVPAPAEVLPEAASAVRAQFTPGAARVGGQVHHAQHGEGTILAVRGDRLSPRLEIQFARGRPVVLPAKFVEFAVEFAVEFTQAVAIP